MAQHNEHVVTRIELRQNPLKITHKGRFNAQSRGQAQTFGEIGLDHFAPRPGMSFAEKRHRLVVMRLERMPLSFDAVIRVVNIRVGSQNRIRTRCSQSHGLQGNRPLRHSGGKRICLIELSCPLPEPGRDNTFPRRDCFDDGP